MRYSNYSLMTFHRLPRLPHCVSDWLLFTLLSLVGLLASNAHANGEAQTTKEGALQLTIDNIRTDQGPIMIQIMNSEAVFNGNGAATASLMLPAREGSVHVVIDALPPGEYAVRVMHDVDGNGELKTNLVGIPKEPWGISNNATGRFGPPKWKDARFTLPATGQQTITLR